MGIYIKHAGNPAVIGLAAYTAAAARRQKYDQERALEMAREQARESDENIRLAGGHAAIRYTVLDATYVLKDGILAPPPLSLARFLRGLEILMRSVFAFLPAEKIEAVARPRRWKKRLLRMFGKRDRGSDRSNSGAGVDKAK